MNLCRKPWRAAMLAVATTVTMRAMTLPAAAQQSPSAQQSPAAQQSPSAQQSLAERRVQHLRHGINTSIWFAQSPKNYTVERLRTFTTPEDLALIHKLGFDHIRLSIDPTPLEGWERGTPEGTAFMAELDKAVHAALDDKLAVIIDIHPETPYKATLFTGSEGVERFGELWARLAQHFASLDPERVFFELMNEPEQTDPYRWQGIESLTAARIRTVAPQFTLIASAAHWDGLSDLLQMAPIGDDNVIYTFHDYEPFAFTHQGATWTQPEVRPLRHVPYPSTPENVQPNLQQEPTLAGRYFVEQYGLDRWDARRVDDTIAFAQQWGAAHHVPVYCGEFGVHRPFAESSDRDRWLHDMRVALEGHGIGWAMWDYQTNFGAVTKANGATTVDQGVISALGLQPQP